VNQRTELHLAFSCYVFRRRDDALLITRRALDKREWPGLEHLEPFASLGGEIIPV
jgi:isopentenyldiphosphate isomerase